MANGQEVARPFFQHVEVVLEGDIPSEDIAEYFGWELGNVQQRVPSAFEFDNDPLVLSDLLLQILDGFDVDLATESISDQVRLWYALDGLAHAGSDGILPPLVGVGRDMRS